MTSKHRCVQLIRDMLDFHRVLRCLYPARRRNVELCGAGQSGRSFGQPTDSPLPQHLSLVTGELPRCSMGHEQGDMMPLASVSGAYRISARAL